MTLLVAGFSLVISVAMAIGVTTIGRAETADSRAQLAADAAALAAVAESGPLANGVPFEAADRFAKLNGARVVSCICERGALAMQVTIELNGVVARARAEIDPSLIRPADLGVNGLQPEMATAVEELLAAGQGAFYVASGYRNGEEQHRLWAQALATYGSAEVADDWVARPGHSFHELGLAVDIGGDIERAARLVTELGLPLIRPLSHEPHHFELIGARS